MQLTFRQRITFVTPFYLVSAIILFMPSRGIGEFSPYDGVIHISLFGILGLVTFFTFSKQTLYAAWFLVCYGAYSEIIQSFIPTRSTSARDLFNDYIGIAIALLVFVFVTRTLLEQKTKPLAHRSFKRRLTKKKSF